MDTFEVVVEYLKNSQKPVSASQIAAATGIDRKDVNNVMNKLKKEERITSPKVCYWELKR
jgi:biotin operon repressor